MVRSKILYVSNSYLIARTLPPMKSLFSYPRPLPLHRMALSAAVVLTLLLCPQGMAKDNFLTATSRYSTILKKAYNPPPRDPSRTMRSGTGGGVRGCGEPLVALAPRFHSDGQTVSRYPTFTWYNFNNSSLFAELELYEYQPDGNLKQVFVGSIDTTSGGYASYTLPETEAGLSLGKTYLWRVVDYCDELFEAMSYQIMANVTVVESGELPDASPVEQAKAYAENGIWYDAMALVYTATEPDAVALRQELLNDLVGIEQDFFAEKQTLMTERQRDAIASIVEQLEDVAQLP